MPLPTSPDSTLTAEQRLARIRSFVEDVRAGREDVLYRYKDWYMNMEFLLRCFDLRGDKIKELKSAIAVEIAERERMQRTWTKPIYHLFEDNNKECANPDCGAGRGTHIFMPLTEQNIKDKWGV